MPPTRTRAATSRDRPPGQDRDAEPTGPRGRDAAERAQGPLRERLDAGGGRVARPDGERPVEVDHDQQRCGNGRRRAPRRRGRDGRGEARDRVSGVAAPADVTVGQ